MPHARVEQGLGNAMPNKQWIEKTLFPMMRNYGCVSQLLLFMITLVITVVA